MSLVGPRPLLQRYQPYFTIRERTRFTVRPGITGLAQIRGRNDRSWERRLSDDVEYVQRSGLLLDFFILARTVSVTVLGRGMVVDPTASALDLDAERCNDVQVKELGPESATEVAAVLSSSYERAWFPCSPVFEPGFPAVVEGWLGAGDCLLGVLHFGCLVAVAQIRSLPGRWHLNHFAVRPEHQGWGIAELLLSKIHDRFADRSISLHVDERNRRAFNFYFRQGYRATGCSIINTIQLPSQSGFCSARMLDGALEAELKVRGFCTLSIPGLAGSFTYLTGDRVYIGGELRKEDALVIGKWLGSGRIVIPETSRPIAWPVVDRWRVLSLVRDPETPRNKLEA